MTSLFLSLHVLFGVPHFQIHACVPTPYFLCATTEQTTESAEVFVWFIRLPSLRPPLILHVIFCTMLLMRHKYTDSCSNHVKNSLSITQRLSVSQESSCF